MTQTNYIETVLEELFEDAKYDHLKMIKGVAKSIFRPMQPSDFQDAYLSISKDQGEDLVHLIKEKNLRNVVEFGTSFGISTLYLAQGILHSGGHIITTELLDHKAKKAIENFERAGVRDHIEVRVGDALSTLSDHTDPIDLLLLDGWKDLYLPLFQMLERNFHSKTVIYVDNADMADAQSFLLTIAQNKKYQLQSRNDGKVVLITM